jgi:hypothetical protein
MASPAGRAEAHRVSVVFRDSPDVPKRVVEFDMKPGETARVPPASE